MKLTKSVGKGTFPAAKDVMIVQKCLSSIKIKTKFGTQPVWKGKVEGKNSADLIKAIEAFQQCEGLKITGKIEAIGPTFQRPQIPAGGIYAPNEEWRKNQNKWIDLQIRRIQIEVAIEHWNVSAKDNLGVLGKLNRDQIATYHHKVFQDFYLPPEAFGGTFFEGGIHSFWNNLLVPLWCKNCEKLEFEK